MQERKLIWTCADQWVKHVAFEDRYTFKVFGLGL